MKVAVYFMPDNKLQVIFGELPYCGYAITGNREDMEAALRKLVAEDHPPEIALAYKTALARILYTLTILD